MQTLITNIQGYSIHDGPGIRTLVFLKGCSLKCQWCANPEGIHTNVELGFNKTLCKHCGSCLSACEAGALIWEADECPRIDREKCTMCGACVSACRGNALVTYGKMMSVEEVFDAVRRDKLFYDSTGGGVTVSGGEPLLHPEFVKALFDECHKAGINTCMETAGCVSSSVFQFVLPSTDHVLYDIKFLDSEKHYEYTGQHNDLILANAKILAESGVDFLFRMPLIPGINDSPQNIRETADFLKSLGPEAARLQLMPYHRFGESKYEAMDRRYLLKGLQKMPPEQVEAVRQSFEDLGIQCTVSS